jgi:hypothetical protein
VANGTAEILTPDGDADEERGIQLAELYANFYTPDDVLRTTVDEVAMGVPVQAQQTHDVLDTLSEDLRTESKEGGKALHGAFDPHIRFAGGLSVKGAIRGREIVRINRQRAAHLGRYVVPRIVPGGR